MSCNNGIVVDGKLRSKFRHTRNRCQNKIEEREELLKTLLVDADLKKGLARYRNGHIRDCQSCRQTAQQTNHKINYVFQQRMENGIGT